MSAANWLAEAPETLTLLEHCALQAMIWGMPAVNFQRMFQAGVDGLGLKANEIVYWSGLIGWQCQLLTPNQDVIYILPFLDTSRAGPVVVEVPPADTGVLVGTLMDAWKMPLVDVGMTGADKGKGGRYLILPPGHEGEVPEGYTALSCATHMAYGLFRSLAKDTGEAGVRAAADYARRIRIFPLSQARSLGETVFHDTKGRLYDATIPYDAGFFGHLNRFVQREPWPPRDRAMIDLLRSIGIDRGKTFAPDKALAARLDAAAHHAFALLDRGYKAIFEQPYAPSARWAFLASPDFARSVQNDYADTEIYPLDERGVFFTFLFFSPKELGDRQFWLMAHEDARGDRLDGAQSYRLRVPAGVPVTQYWSVTAYDRSTHALIKDKAVASRSSLTPGLAVNADGSVDILFGPEPPKGGAENWLPTEAGARFEVIFRFYGPQPPLFERSWILPDLQPL